MRWFLLFLSFYSPTNIYAQSSFSEEIKFSEYLLNNKLYDDALLQLQQMKKNTYYNTAELDSIRYYLGKLYYDQQQIEDAILNYSELKSENHPFFTPSKYYEYFLQSYQGNLKISKEAFHTLNPSDSLLLELKIFELSAIALLERDVSQFQTLDTQLSGDFYAIESSRGTLHSVAQDLQVFKPKSGVAAGLMSIIIPGSGKMYVGKLGQGIAALLQKCSFRFTDL